MAGANGVTTDGVTTGAGQGEERERCLALCDRLLEQLGRARRAHRMARGFRAAHWFLEEGWKVAAFSLLGGAALLWLARLLLGQLLGTAVAVALMVGAGVLVVGWWRRRRTRSAELGVQAAELEAGLRQLNAFALRLVPLGVSGLPLELVSLWQLERDLRALRARLRAAARG